MRYILIFIFLLEVSTSSAQYNLLGHSQSYITSFFNLRSEYNVKADTINNNSIILICKTNHQYPYYTYEIERKRGVCNSFGIVSRDKKTLKNYVNMLNYLGEIITSDSLRNNFTYRVERKNKVSYFAIKQPFINSKFISRRGIFYIIISEEVK